MQEFHIAQMSIQLRQAVRHHVRCYNWTRSIASRPDLVPKRRGSLYKVQNDFLHFDCDRTHLNFYGGTVSRQYFTSSLLSMKIYTKTGDKGTTSLFTGERRRKNDLFFEALGATDELSSYLALAREHAKDSGHPYEERLCRIQCVLQDVASSVATPKSSAREAHLKKVQFSSRHTAQLEKWIDEYTELLPPLTNFILPGGGKASASLHVARTVCRRAERCIVPLVLENEINEEVLIYVNRLSDFLFTVARYAAKLDNREETIYIRENSPE